MLRQEGLIVRGSLESVECCRLLLLSVPYTEDVTEVSATVSPREDFSAHRLEG